MLSGLTEGLECTSSQFGALTCVLCKSLLAPHKVRTQVTAWGWQGTDWLHGKCSTPSSTPRPVRYSLGSFPGPQLGDSSLFLQTGEGNRKGGSFAPSFPSTVPSCIRIIAPSSEIVLQCSLKVISNLGSVPEACRHHIQAGSRGDSGASQSSHGGGVPQATTPKRLVAQAAQEGTPVSHVLVGKAWGRGGSGGPGAPVEDVMEPGATPALAESSGVNPSPRQCVATTHCLAEDRPQDRL